MPFESGEEDATFQRPYAEAGLSGPERTAASRQLGGLLASAVSRLPLEHRLVFVMRHIEKLSTTETSESLGISAENVKVRLFRARRQLRRDLGRELATAASWTSTFLGDRCDRITSAVMNTLLS